MRHALALVFSTALCAFAAAGCGADAKPQPFADMRWLVRCDSMHGCAGNKIREMFQYNGEEQRTITCGVEARAGGHVFGFKAFGVDPDSPFAGPYGIEVTNMFYMGEGASVLVNGGPACKVRVHEESNDFSGGCGPNPPSASQPCQFRNFAISGTQITGSLLCQNLAAERDTTVFRELTDPGSDASKPVSFDLQNCAGL